MDAEREKNGDDGLLAPFKWRRLYRIPAGLGVVVGGGALWAWGLGLDGKSEWAALLWAGLIMLYGAFLAWELLLLGIAALVIYWAWGWIWNPSGLSIAGVIFVCWLLLLYQSMNYRATESELRSEILRLRRELEAERQSNARHY